MLLKYFDAAIDINDSSKGFDDEKKRIRNCPPVVPIQDPLSSLPAQVSDFLLSIVESRISSND